MPTATGAIAAGRVRGRVAETPKPVPSPPTPKPAVVPAPPPAAAAAADTLVAAGLSADQYFQKGKELAYQHKHAEAIAQLSEAIRLKPANPIYWNTRGFANFLARKYAGSLTDLNEAIRLNPKYANAYKNRAAVKLKLGDNPGSAEDLAKAKESGQ